MFLSLFSRAKKKRKKNHILNLANEQEEERNGKCRETSAQWCLGLWPLGP
jgi:hypothetical protein